MSPLGCNSTHSTPAPSPAPPMPGDARPCCLLTPHRPPLIAGTRGGIGMVDPAAAGTHHFGGGDIFGITYTCAAGFFDFGHARDTIDQTRYHHHRLTLGGNSAAGSSYPSLFKGAIVTVSTAIPASDALETAASIAYDESVWHEIFTWYGMVASGIVGQNNSSFSPEDLVSNLLGTWVARRAIAAGGAFDTAVTKELSTLLTSLGARRPADTQAAFTAITGRWIASAPDLASAGLDDRYLLRRNFNVDPIVPWFAPGISFCTSTTWPAGVPTGFSATITGRYDIEFPVPSWASAIGSKLKRSAFASAIATIKAEAAKPGPAPPAGPPGGIDRGYGPDFDKP